MGRSGRCVTAALAFLLTSACGASVRVTPFVAGKYPSRAVDHPIQMFSTKTPECPYEELGLIRSEPENGLTRWERVVDGLLTHARQMGGDAVILRQAGEFRATGDEVVVNDDVLAGTVIRFQGAGCQS